MVHPTVTKSNSLSIVYLLQNPSILFENAGPRTHVSHSVAGLQQAGHQVTILGLRGRKILCAKSIDDIKYSNSFGLSSTWPFQVVESGVRRGQTELNLPYLGLFDSFRFYEVCCKKVGKVDLFHERHALLNIGGALAAKRLGIPLVLEVNADLFFEYEFRGYPLRGVQKTMASWMTRFAYRSASAIVCVSEIVRRDLEVRWGISPERVFVLPNAADVKKFAVNGDSMRIRRELGLNDDLLVVFVGSFHSWHDLDLLVDSFAYIVRLGLGAKLVLVGDGSNRSRIGERIGNLGIRESVIFTGSVEPRRIPAILAACDVAVAPYPPVSEGFWGSPMKIFEYMAAGKAVVASSGGQISEIIQHGYSGLLVDPGDVNGFAQAIIRLLKDSAERKRLGQNARRQALKRHSREKYIMRLEKIYAKALRLF